MFGVLVIPFIMVAMAYGKKGFKGIIPYLTFAGVSTCIPFSFGQSKILSYFCNVFTQ